MQTEPSPSIQELIDAGRIVEAGTLLAVTESSLSVAEQNAYRLEIEQRQHKAETFITQAESLEQAGKNEEAKTVYMSVLNEVCDFPGLHEHIKRVDDAIALSRAIQRRNKRIRATAAQTTTQEKSNNPSRRFIITGAVLLTAVATLTLFITVRQDPVSPPPIAKESSLDTTITAHQQTSTAPAVNAKTDSYAPAAEISNQIRPAPPLTPTTDRQSVTTQAEAPRPAKKKETTNNTLSSVTPSTEDRQEETTVQKNGQPQDNSAPLPAVYYTVQPGDCLSLIAERVLCRQSAWEAVYRLNKDQIADPERLRTGMRLRLTGLESQCPPGNQ